ncbi:hypothetical protein B0J14DRAFT_683481 [Halenospora varia]|nr:hypothetical protein B0J14DRAFT_683481 [Halenospora varia]
MATYGLSKRPPTSLLQQHQNLDTTNRVTYLSKNSQDGRQFEAITPPNSVHAKKLAEIAMLVQNNESRASGWKKPFAGLLGGGGSGNGNSARMIEGPCEGDRMESGEVRRQVLYDKDGRAVEVEVETDEMGTGRVRRPGMIAGAPVPRRQETPGSWTSDLRPQANSGARMQEQQYNAPHPPLRTANNGYTQQPQQHQQSYPPPASTQFGEQEYDEEVQRPYISDLTQKNARQDSAFQAQEVHRYQTDHQTGYKVKTGTGELRVSAPAGSSEARAFDGVVRKMSSKEQDRGKRGDDRRVARKSGHKSHEKKSSWGLW